MNFLDILISSPQYVYEKSVGQDRRICSLILGVKGFESRESTGQAYLHVLFHEHALDVR